MAYCSECGSHNDESRLTCEICGSCLGITDEMVTNPVDIDRVSEPDSIPSEDQIFNGIDGDYGASIEAPDEITEGSATDETPVPEGTEEFMGNAGHLFSQEEAQLGKGLIKPTNIQLGMDGYHFTYEKLNSHFSKTESFTERGTAEKRVVSSDVIETPDSDIPFKQSITETANLPISPDPLKEKTAEDQPSASVSGETEANMKTGAVHLKDAEKEDNELIQEELPSDNGTLEEIDLSMEEIENAGVETNLDVSEEEDKEEAEFTILVGRQTWFGVPLPGTYQVSNKTVTVTDQNNQTHQMGLDSIFRVELRQSILAKLLGIGTVKLIPGKPGIDPLLITGVIHPKELVKKIESLLQ